MLAGSVAAERPTGFEPSQPTLVRLMPNGSRDPAFGVDGRVGLSGRPGDTQAQAASALADGRIAVLVGAQAGRRTWVVRLQADGARSLLWRRRCRRHGRQRATPFDQRRARRLEHACGRRGSGRRVSGPRRRAADGLRSTGPSLRPGGHRRDPRPRSHRGTRPNDHQRSRGHRDRALPRRPPLGRGPRGAHSGRATATDGLTKTAWPSRRFDAQPPCATPGKTSRRAWSRCPTAGSWFSAAWACSATWTLTSTSQRLR
jgi:hypothetical protein